MTRAGDKLYSDDPRFYAIPIPEKRLHFWRYLIPLIVVGLTVAGVIREAL